MTTEAEWLALANEYPRWACPECGGPVREVEVECDMGEYHERWNCLADDCSGRYEDMEEDDLEWVKAAPAGFVQPEETLDHAALLKAGKVLPSLREWVSKKVAS